MEFETFIFLAAQSSVLFILDELIRSQVYAVGEQGRVKELRFHFGAHFILSKCNVSILINLNA